MNGVLVVPHVFYDESFTYNKIILKQLWFG